MLKNRPALVGQLLKTDEHFRQLYEEHRALDHQLKELDKRLYLTTEQQLEVTKLKKLKLKNKDRMEEILVQHERTYVVEGASPSP